VAAAACLSVVLAVAALGAERPHRMSVSADAPGSTSVGASAVSASGVPGVSGSSAGGPLGASAAQGPAGTGGGAAGRQAGGGVDTPGRSGPRVNYDDGASDTEVRIGGSTFTSGPAAVYGQQIAVGMAAGVNYVNEHGGINGRRLVAKIYDDGGDPAKQLANTKRLVEVDHVFALSMVYAPVAGQYAASKGIPVLHLGQFNEEFTNPWWFPIGGPQGVAAMELANYGGRTLGVKKVAIFYLDAGTGNYSRAYADTVARYWKDYGVDATTLVPFSPDQTSCSNGISAAHGANVDFIDFEIDAGHVIQCGVEAQIQGYKPPKLWGGYLIGVPVIHEALGDYSVGMYAFDAFGADYDSPAYNAAVKQVSSGTDTYSSVTISYFIAAVLARDAMSQLGTTFSRAHLRDVLNSFTSWTPGLSSDANQPHWTWRTSCHIALDGGYVIQIHKHPDGALRWDQITPQYHSVPLPPGEAKPAEFAACPNLVPAP
jgi:ABC-type branched-subunit amino acid transport system substrate-binding protein